MDEMTGQIRSEQELKNESPEVQKRQIPIDHYPAKKCPACDGRGWIGRANNKKVIPCLCVFKDASIWAMAVYQQRMGKRKSPDKFMDAMTKIKARQIAEERRVEHEVPVHTEKV